MKLFHSRELLAAGQRLQLGNRRRPALSSRMLSYLRQDPANRLTARQAEELFVCSRGAAFKALEGLVNKGHTRRLRDGTYAAKERS